MNSIGRFGACIGLVAIAVSGTPSQATLVTYDFTASVSSIYEYTASTGVIEYLSQSTFPGTLLSMGDSISGRFSYDTEAPLSPYQPLPQVSGTYQLYQSAAAGRQGLKFAVSNGLAFSSDGSPTIQVADNASTFGGWDVVSIGASDGHDPVLFEIAQIVLFDELANAFQSSAIPYELELGSFGYRSLSTAWVNRNDGNQLQVTAQIESFSLFTVPEPNGYALLLAGLLALGVTSRNRAVQVAQN